MSAPFVWHGMQERSWRSTTLMPWHRFQHRLKTYWTSCGSYNCILRGVMPPKCLLISWTAHVQHLFRLAASNSLLNRRMTTGIKKSRRPPLRNGKGPRVEYWKCSPNSNSDDGRKNTEVATRPPDKSTVPTARDHPSRREIRTSKSIAN